MQHKSEQSGQMGFSGGKFGEMQTLKLRILHYFLGDSKFFASIGIFESHTAYCMCLELHYLSLTMMVGYNERVPSKNVH